ncbi:hypothetical protein ACFIJ5_14260 [Haloimpatiens sp. FM7330]|uniref:hypothetical protein n=1 Tax=Haloimpatiens sp. FM7330 TaxID=3298610 RepID=UPI00363F7CE8
MKNSKKIIIIVICALIVGGIVYIVSPKRGYLGDLVLSEYKGSNFNAIRVNGFNMDITTGKVKITDQGKFTCKDKEKINKFLSYLEKMKVVEYKKGSVYFGSGDEYTVDISTENDKEISVCASLSICDKDLQLISVKDKDDAEKTYKILNDEFDMKYIEGLK